MKKIIIGIILIVLGGIICFLCARTTGISADEKEYINNAVYVSNEQIDPANEGKIIITSGKPALKGYSTDPQMQLSIESPFVARTVEMYINCGSEEEPKMEWTKIFAPSEANPKVSQNFYGTFSIGNYVVSGLFLENKAPLSDYVNFSRVQADVLGLSLDTPVNEPQYFTNAPNIANEDNLLIYENAVRISYQFVNVNELSDYTVVGTQKGNTISATNEFIPKVIPGNHTDADAVIKALQTRSVATTIVGFFVFLICIIIGLILIFPTIKKKYLS